MKRYSLFFLILIILAASCVNTKELHNGIKYDPSGCLTALTSLAKKTKNPFTVSSYHLFNDRPPAPGMNKLSQKLIEIPDKINVPAYCYKEVGMEFKKFDGAETTYSKIKEAKPISLFFYKNRYYLQLLYDYYWEEDGEGTALSTATLIYDNKGRFLKKIDKSSTWFSYEGTELIVDSKISSNNILYSTLIFQPKIRNKNGTIMKYEVEIESIKKIDLKL